MNALTFNQVSFTPVNQNDGQIWLTSAELAKALGYSRTDKVTEIYNRNRDEFTGKMTTTLKMGVVRKTGTVQLTNRIFSLRGCHLIAMLARTKIAKQFRKWVLDILEQEVQTTADQRTPLRKACDSLAVGNMLVSEAYKLVAKQFDCDSIEQIPSHRLAEAVAFTYETKLRLQKTEATQNINQEKLYNLCADMIDMGMDYLTLVNNINVAMSNDNDYTLREIAGRVKNAINFSKESNLTNRRNQPMFDCGELNFSYGNKIIYTPKKMQMLAYYAR